MSTPLIHRTFAITARQGGDQGGTGAPPAEPEIIISSQAVDREGDIVVANGGDWRGWAKSGSPVLFAHRADELPVAKGTRLWVDSQNQTHARFRWIEGDPFAARVRNAFAQGVLAASIGFRPITQEPLGRGGLKFTQWEGVEFSLTPCPANVDAIAVTRALGLLSSTDDGAIVLRLDPDPEIVLWLSVDPLVDRAQRGHRFHVDLGEVRRVSAEIVPTLVRNELRAAIARETRAAVNRARGRVD